MPRRAQVTNSQLLTKLNSIDRKLDDMEKTIHYQEMRSIARTRNAVLYNNHKDIELLLIDQGGVPMNYPTRAIDIANIPINEINDILQVHGLVSDENESDDSRRRRLAEFLGEATNDDACARITIEYKYSKSNPEFSAKYSDVKACLESFPYDKEIAESKTIQGFYVYLSQAKEEPQQGFSFRAVDLIKELDALLSKNYTSEFQFMYDVRTLFYELKDAHLSLSPDCYTNAFLYSQQLSLYSVINKEGVQIIKIFDDEIDGGNFDCEVTHIDGRPSMEVIQEFADTMIFYSKDAGVRFNMALATLIIDEMGKSSIEYSVICANDVKTKFVREWKIGSQYYGRFNTSKEFRDALCLLKDIPTNPSDIFSEIYKPKIYNNSMSEGEVVYNTLMATFFILSDNKIGVVTIPALVSLIDNVDQMFELQTGFSLLEDKGVTKIVLDFSANVGGDRIVTGIIETATAQSIHIKDKIQFTIPPSLSIKNLTRWAARTADLVAESNSIFDIFGYKDPNSDKHFSSLDEFIGNHTYVRGETPMSYTSNFIGRYSQKFSLFVKLLAGNINEYKWNSEDIMILTNGNCVSPEGPTLSPKLLFIIRQVYGPGSDENESDDTLRRRLTDFLGVIDCKGFERTLQQSLEKIRVNATWLKRDSKYVEEWLSAIGFLK
ncbi:18900_t:CDS:10 [Funneliformis geosporum]|nr:18900_t:CDS:10 [Funneliformis geosporum]